MIQTIITMIAAIVAAIFTFSNYRRRSAVSLWTKEDVQFGDVEMSYFQVEKNGVISILFPRLGAGVEVHGSNGEHIIVPWSQVKLISAPPEPLTKHVSWFRF